MKNNNKFVQKGKVSVPNTNSAYLAVRGIPEVGKVSAKKEQSALLSSRGEPEKGRVTYPSRYK